MICCANTTNKTPNRTQMFVRTEYPEQNPLKGDSVRRGGKLFGAPSEQNALLFGRAGFAS